MMRGIFYDCLWNVRCLLADIRIKRNIFREAISHDYTYNESFTWLIDTWQEDVCANNNKNGSGNPMLLCGILELVPFYMRKILW